MSHIAYYTSPIGLIEITGDEDGISAVSFAEERKSSSTRIHESLKETVYQLEEYFSGIRKDFGIRLNPAGTEFQKKVWEQLAKIPFGKTTSYLDIARKLGDANLTRAVGNANGSNPVAVLIPCHRIIGVNGKLVGYSGGLWRKEWLLNHEKSVVFGRQIQLFS